jgi:hypothetical protein
MSRMINDLLRIVRAPFSDSAFSKSIRFGPSVARGRSAPGAPPEDEPGASSAGTPPAAVPAAKRPLVLGMHSLAETDADARTLVGEVPALAKRGVNLLIAEVDY